MRLARLSAAEGYYQRAIQIDPDDGWTHLYIGNLHYARQRYRHAIASFTRGSKLLPEEACPHWCLGDVHDAMGNFSLAGSCYRRAVKVDPDCKRAKRNLREWYERQYTLDESD